jgi:hypothetical protein
MLDTNYVVLITWVANAAFYSFKSEGSSIWDDPDLSDGDAVGYFVTESLTLAPSQLATKLPSDGRILCHGLDCYLLLRHL